MGNDAFKCDICNLNEIENDNNEECCKFCLKKINTIKDFSNKIQEIYNKINVLPLIIKFKITNIIFLTNNLFILCNELKNNVLYNYINTDDLIMKLEFVHKNIVIIEKIIDKYSKKTTNISSNSFTLLHILNKQ